ncbi:MAG: sigma-54 dependent transcriptional regulator [Armatimonadota bacterium]
MAKILIAEDDLDSRAELRQLLEIMAHNITDVKDSKKAASCACSMPYDLVILGLEQKAAGIKAIRAIREECPDLAILVTVDAGSISSAFDALKLGVSDYLVKPWNSDEVRVRVDRILEECWKTRQLKHLFGEMEHHFDLHHTAGMCQDFKQAIALALKIAATDKHILVSGEYGTGKECLARSIHRRSKRASRRFVRIDCGSATAPALDAMLFGIEDGKFSKGVDHGIGQVDLASGGTIFLDEIANTSLSTQSVLNRMLRDGQFSRIGGTAVVDSNVRIIASTSTNLAAAVESGNFDDDLYQVLRSTVITLPPLRDRHEDIPLLADYFIKKYAAETGKHISSISGASLDLMLSCEWTGNIREFRNCIERSVILCDGDCIQPSHLAINGSKSLAKRKQPAAMKSLREIERDHIKKVLIACNWNRSSAASILEIDRKTLRSKIREFGFIPPEENKREKE